MEKGAIIVVGAQWGDEIKGLTSAYLSQRENAKIVCRAGTGSNAEHGLFLSDKKTYLKVNQLPLGWMFNKDCEIRIGSGVAVDGIKLLFEANKYDLMDRIKVDYRCPMITKEHILAEQESKGMSAIGSTFSGTGFCRADFVLRKAQQAKNSSYFTNHLFDCADEINKTAREGVVIIECSQGTFLSLAVSNDYPNVTSDNVTSMAAADDVLLNWKNIKEVVLAVKALPTREGAGKMGNSRELSSKEIIDSNFVEPSSIGGVTRRKADGIDFDLLKYAVEINGATQIALTFLDHFDSRATEVTDFEKLPSTVHHLINYIEEFVNVPVTILNTGKPFWSMIDLTLNAEVDLKKYEKDLLKFA